MLAVIIQNLFFFSKKDLQPEYIPVSKTYYKNAQKLIQFNNYNIIDENRNDGRGIAIFVHKAMVFTPLDCDSWHENQYQRFWKSTSRNLITSSKRLMSLFRTSKAKTWPSLIFAKKLVKERKIRRWPKIARYEIFTKFHPKTRVSNSKEMLHLFQ